MTYATPARREPEVSPAEMELRVVRRAIRLEAGGVRALKQLLRFQTDGWRDAVDRVHVRRWLDLTAGGDGGVDYSVFRVTAAGYRAVGERVAPWCAS